MHLTRSTQQFQLLVVRSVVISPKNEHLSSLCQLYTSVMVLQNVQKGKYFIKNI